MKTELIAAACSFAVLATTSSAQVPVNIAEKVRATGQAMDPTIGQLYAAIEDNLKKVCKGNKYFIKDHSRQVTPEYFYNSGGQIMMVTNLEEALQALDVIFRTRTVL